MEETEKFLKLIDEFSKGGVRITISNKAGLGYWWVYLTDENKSVVQQGNNPVEAFLGAAEKLKGD